MEEFVKSHDKLNEMRNFYEEINLIENGTFLTFYDDPFLKYIIDAYSNEPFPQVSLKEFSRQEEVTPDRTTGQRKSTKNVGHIQTWEIFRKRIKEKASIKRNRSDSKNKSDKEDDLEIWMDEILNNYEKLNEMRKMHEEINLIQNGTFLTFYNDPFPKYTIDVYSEDPFLEVSLKEFFRQEEVIPARTTGTILTIYDDPFPEYTPDIYSEYSLQEASSHQEEIFPDGIIDSDNILKKLSQWCEFLRSLDEKADVQEQFGSKEDKNDSDNILKELSQWCEFSLRLLEGKAVVQEQFENKEDINDYKIKDDKENAVPKQRCEDMLELTDEKINAIKDNECNLRKFSCW